MKAIKPIYAIAIVLTLIASNSAKSQVIAGKGNYSASTPGFDRGYQATLYCGNWPESWLRGSAFLDKSTGVLTMKIGLETDATFAGPKGQILVYITDANGYLLARIASAEIGRGGKFAGTAAIDNIQSSMYVGYDIANRATNITVVPHLTGFIDRFWNIKFDALIDAAGYIKQFVMFFF